ncbi:hypothetical protein ACFWOY_03385 [Streptomyces sp. NPDC058423]|uniref:hypothetical protein n=1 Tax=unclassified Streptomyces TaxID=2593676 RepID=UPI0036544192
MLACGCMDLGKIAWVLLELGAWGVVLLVAGALLVVCLTLGALQLLVWAVVRRRRGVVEPAVEPVSLSDFRWEGERHEP